MTMIFRQSEFLGEFAELYQGFTGIGYWYIGLTDLGKIPLLSVHENKSKCFKFLRVIGRGCVVKTM